VCVESRFREHHEQSRAEFAGWWGLRKEGHYNSRRVNKYWESQTWKVAHQLRARLVQWHVEDGFQDVHRDCHTLLAAWLFLVLALLAARKNDIIAVLFCAFKVVHGVSRAALLQRNAWPRTRVQKPR